MRVDMRGGIRGGISRAGSGPNDTALAMRREFDLSFARAPHAETAHLEKLLAIRLGADAYAIRIAEIGGLYVDRPILHLPTPVAGLLGVAGFRGRIAPVYDLAALLGHARQTCQAAPRWLILTRLQEPVALAFDAFDGHFAVAPERIVKAPDNASAPAGGGPHLRDAVLSDDAVRPIIHLQSLLDNIQRQGDVPVRPRSDQT